MARFLCSNSIEIEICEQFCRVPWIIDRFETDKQEFHFVHGFRKETIRRDSE